MNETKGVDISKLIMERPQMTSSHKHHSKEKKGWIQIEKVQSSSILNTKLKIKPWTEIGYINPKTNKNLEGFTKN